MNIIRNIFDYLPFLAPTCGILFVTFGLLNVVDGALSLPEVHQSWSTGECIKVVEHDGSMGSCLELPVKYKQVLVR